MTRQYNLENIRTLLTEGYSVDELRHLCHDMYDFRPVYSQLAPTSSQAEIIDRLLEYAEQKVKFEKLLAWAKKHNPERYKKHQPYQGRSQAPATESAPDLDELRRDYCAKIAEKYEYITVQGISPKVQNRTIGIRMEDLFIPIKAIAGDLETRIELMVRAIRGEATEESKEAAKSLLKAIGSYRRRTELRNVTDVDVTVMLPSEVEYEKLVEIFGRTEATGQQKLASEYPVRFLGQPSSSESINIENLLSFPRIVVQGDPGSGKSTLSRYIAWAVATRQTKLIGEGPTARLPIRVRAIEFSEALEHGRIDSLDKYLIDEAGRFAPLIEQTLIQGNALILVDGLDEVGKLALRALVKERVDDFMADPIFGKNQMMITTRIVGYERSGIMGQFPHFTLAELDDEQIANFVNSWYSAIHNEMPAAIDVETERQQLLEAIARKEGIQRMARNPLLLTIIALIKWQGRALPDLRILLYDAAAQTLIRSWPLTQRQVELDELFIREWLAPVALRIFANETSDLIDEYSLLEELVTSMRRLKSISEFEARQASRELLENVSLHSGILLPRGTDADGRNLYGFLHQTFAEYLTAYYLAGRWEDGVLNLREYAHHPYWQEVLLLMAGHLGTQRRAKAGQFIKAIHDLHSSPYESIIHRDLLLAGRILGDGVPAGPGDLIEALLLELLELWRNPPIFRFQADVEEVIKDLGGTEYAPVLARLAQNTELNEGQVLTLARYLEPDYFRDHLAKLLEVENDWTRYQAAEILVRQDDSRALEALAKLLSTKEDWLRYQAAELLAQRNDPRGVNTLIKFLGTSSETLSNRAAELLVARDDPKIMNALVKLLDSEEPEIRYQAGWILTERGNHRGLNTLVNLLSTENEQILSCSQRCRNLMTL